MDKATDADLKNVYELTVPVQSRGNFEQHMHRCGEQCSQATKKIGWDRWAIHAVTHAFFMPGGEHAPCVMQTIFVLRRMPGPVQPTKA